MRTLILCSFILTLFSCQPDERLDLLYGEWKMESWYNDTTNIPLNAKMDFSFSDDMRYVVDYGSEKEEGQFWLANEYLHTVEDGKEEKKVEVVTLSQDSLVFLMNRTGVIERVTLLKSNK